MTPATILILATTAIGAGDEPSPTRNSLAREAIQRFSRAYTAAAEDFDKRVSRARRQLVGELKSAAESAHRSNNIDEAKAIAVLAAKQERLVEQPIRPPVPLFDASVKVADSVWKVSMGQVFQFGSDGSVSALNTSGTELAKGDWKEVGADVVTIKFKGFYVGIIEPNGTKMRIVGDGSDWTAIRVE